MEKKSFKTKDAEGRVYGPFTKMSSSYDVVNFKTINYEIGKEPPFDAVIHFATYLYTFIFIYIAI